jgi:hypothetical protein
MSPASDQAEAVSIRTFDIVPTRLPTNADH